MKVIATSILMHQDVIDVTTRTDEPDPAWVYVDAFGKEHRWVNGDLPTLEARSETCTVRVQCEECGCYHVEDSTRFIGYFVPGTDERVKPGMREIFAPDMMSWSGDFTSNEFVHVGGEVDVVAKVNLGVVIGRAIIVSVVWTGGMEEWHGKFVGLGVPVVGEEERCD